ncbi:molybdate ABC transporter permease subunit [Deefgea tanakiae]|uniref:Molybdenum transport system permease n=1 Tax=Deefgea tanakiae TaxID=2865840 RepID=A0ABX8Z310_9NEIS|nr:molybdate ABC transporter permease subunit [Deefgea tanakiae]QZA76956.1 molybdate ABC transporter permease subunit [Deefgea tanakiae]
MLDPQPLLLTLKLATHTTLLLTIVGIPLSYWLAFGSSRIRYLAEVISSLPLVLPPTVLGFYLLLLFSPTSWVGAWLASALDLRLVFSYPGLVIGSMVFSLPFMVLPLTSAFRQLPSNLLDAARTLGKSEINILARVILPNCKMGLIGALILTFAHTVGEFGVALMIGGNIPGHTQVASIALYHEVETLNYSAAHLYAAVLVGFSFVVLLALRLLSVRMTHE